jgi:hypothetical protein
MREWGTRAQADEQARSMAGRELVGVIALANATCRLSLVLCEG